MAYVTKRTMTFSSLSSIEQEKLLKFGKPIKKQNTNNFTTVYKKLNRNLLVYIEDFELHNIAGFEKSDLDNFYHGCNMMIVRLFDYDVSIYYKGENIILPISQSSYMPNSIVWKRYAEHFQISVKETGKLINPKINQGQKNWFDSGAEPCDRVGEVIRDEYFDDTRKTYGILSIWEVPFMAEQIVVNFCPENLTEITPVTMNKYNQITGYYYGENELLKRLEKSKGIKLPPVVSHRPSPIDYEDL